MRAETWPHESGVRDVLHSSSDKNRELVLTVLVFHVRYSETVMPDARVDGEWQETPEPAVRWSNLTGGNQPKAAYRPYIVVTKASDRFPWSESTKMLTHSPTTNISSQQVV